MFEVLDSKQFERGEKPDFPDFFLQEAMKNSLKHGEAAESRRVEGTEASGFISGYHPGFPRFFSDLKADRGETEECIENRTMEEKVKAQDKVIDDVESGRKELDSAQEKGNYGEMKTDQDLREKGFNRISNDMVTGLDDFGHQGIDGVYYNSQTGEYIIADSKFGTAQLGETSDGKQMSGDWINNRLDASVGKEKADEIRMKMLFEPDKVRMYVAHVEIGGVTYDRLDSSANIVEKDVKIN